MITHIINRYNVRLFIFSYVPEYRILTLYIQLYIPFLYIEDQVLGKGFFFFIKRPRYLEQIHNSCSFSLLNLICIDFFLILTEINQIGYIEIPAEISASFRPFAVAKTTLN